MNTGMPKPLNVPPLSPFPYLAFFGLVLIAFFAGLLVFRSDIFLSVCREDGIVEYSQAAVFFISAVYAGILAVRFLRAAALIGAGIFIFITVLLAVIAAEEISWGQRLLKIETPLFLRETNIQNEINIHNTGFFQSLIFPGYALAGGAALFFALFPSLIPSPGKYKSRRFSHSDLIPFFLPALTYGIYRMIIGDGLRLRRVYPLLTAKRISAVQEPIELLLAFGALFFLIRLRKEISPDCQSGFHGVD